MGCLNSTGQFAHWFGNIHFSGPCNRSCYFCIGQHMMDLDPLNNLAKWPLPGFDEFVARCQARGVREVNLTGTNTDPSLYHHLPALAQELRRAIPEVKLGIRTNGVSVDHRDWTLFNKASVSVPTFDNATCRKIMGGPPPDLARLLALPGPRAVKLNVVLCPESLPQLRNTLAIAEFLGIRKINVREPYGQPHIGDPLPALGLEPLEPIFGMPRYRFGAAEVVYWDVHWVEVESVNLYASGRVSETYPITRGHSPNGTVIAQDQWLKSGRQQAQWLRSTAQPQHIPEPAPDPEKA